MDDATKKEVEQMIKVALKRATDFKERKIGDTPTDANQLTPQKYVDLGGTRALRPRTPNVGQQYWSSQDHYPWFTDGVSSWFSATGSVVSAL